MLYSTDLAKGPVTLLTAERPFTGVGGPDMVDQVAGGFKMATAHRAREDLLLLLLPTLLVESASKHDVNRQDFRHIQLGLISRFACRRNTVLSVYCICICIL